MRDEHGERTGGAAPSGDHLTEDLCNDVLLGLTSHASAEDVGRHARFCAGCETLLQRVTARFETARSRPAPVRDRTGTWVLPSGAVSPDANVVSPHGARRRPGARRLWGWGVATAALLAFLVAWPALVPRDVEPNAYWLPVDQGMLRLRSSSGDDASSLARGLRAYAREDIDTAIPFLQQPLPQEGQDDLRRLYLASSLAHAARHTEALEVLTDLDLETIPQPWRDRGLWVRSLCLDATGNAAEAGAILERLADSEGDIARRAREHLRRGSSQR